MFCLQKLHRFSKPEHSPLYTLFFCEDLTKIRKKLIVGDRTESPCNKCTVNGQLFGQASFDILKQSIQYIDKLPPAEAEYWDDAVREFFLSDTLNELAIIIEHEDFKVYGKKLDFSDDTFNKVKKYLTITKL